MTLRAVGDIFLVASAIPAVLSVIVFARVQWWKTPLGRHMMVYMIVMALVLGLGVVRIVFGTNDVFDIIRLVVFLGVPFVMWWRLFVLLSAQRKGPGFNYPPGRSDTEHSLG